MIKNKAVVNIHSLIDEPCNIQASVCVPCYNGKHVAWLAMESYCRQEPVDFDWEIIICEEPHENMIGLAFFRNYLDRLKAKGCKKFSYIELTEWVNLPEKWKIMGQHVDSNSSVYILQAIDCYAPSNRLRHSHEKICEGYDWVCVRAGYFYSFIDNKMIVYRNPKPKKGLHMAFAAKYATQLTLSERNKGIDSLLMQRVLEINPKAKFYRHDGMLPDSLDTDGYNNISRNRKK